MFTDCSFSHAFFRNAKGTGISPACPTFNNHCLNKSLVLTNIMLLLMILRTAASCRTTDTVNAAPLFFDDISHGKEDDSDHSNDRYDCCKVHLIPSPFCLVQLLQNPGKLSMQSLSCLCRSLCFLMQFILLIKAGPDLL